MKKITAAFLIVLLAQNSFAGEIWVTTSTLSTEKRLSEIAEAAAQRINETDFVSFFDGQMRSPVSKAALNAFLERETLAQKALVSGNFKNALDIYEKLKSDLLSVPNVSGIEKITLAVLVNIAQVKSILRSPGADEDWKQARAWAPAAQLNDEEFSPQIVKKFSAIYPEKSLNVEIQTYSEALVYVDGRRAIFNGEDFFLKLQPGEHQACALAPGSAWSCKKFAIDATRAADAVQIEVAPVVEGTCDDPHYSGPELPQNVKLLVRFDEENCERIYSQQRWYSLLGHHIESLAPQTGSMLEKQFSKPEGSTWDKLSHSTWFWAGVSAVVIGAIVISAQNQNHDQVVVPSQSFR